MNDKVPVVFEGKEYPIDIAIAADDDQLCNLNHKMGLMEA